MMGSKRTEKRKAQRARLTSGTSIFAEEGLHFADLAAGKLPAPDMRPQRTTAGRRAEYTGIDFAVRRDMMHVERPGRPVPEDVGCTVTKLDYRDSRQRRATKGDAGLAMRDTKSGARRLSKISGS